MKPSISVYEAYVTSEEKNYPHFVLLFFHIDMCLSDFDRGSSENNEGLKINYK